MLISSATKAVSELSESLFVPAMIIGLVVEYPNFLINKYGLDLIGMYLGYAAVGFLARLGYESQIQYFIAGTFILPIGIAALFPEYFSSIKIPLQEPTGVCVCVWGFYLIKIFFDHANKREVRD